MAKGVSNFGTPNENEEEEDNGPEEKFFNGWKKFYKRDGSEVPIEEIIAVNIINGISNIFIVICNKISTMIVEKAST